MRRHGRAGGGTKAVTPVPETVSLIHSFDSVTNPNRPVRPSPLASSNIKALPLDLVDRLRSFPLFQSTPESFLFDIGQHLRPQLHAANDYILTEGDSAKAIYWLVRGAVSVTSRDGESIYAELKPGAFFGEIGVLMDRPRTATIVARTRCLLVVLTKEDFRKILPRFPEVENAIRDEAQERLIILERKKKETSAPALDLTDNQLRRGAKRLRDSPSKESLRSEHGGSSKIANNKKRKSPSPGFKNRSSSALANGLVNVRLLLKELPLFSGLPADILHFLGLNAQPRTYPPFADIIQQDSQGREIYFIVRGEVEILTERTQPLNSYAHTNAIQHPEFEVKARLRQGQYFGEVVSLSLAPRRTATVRSISSVECLMISGDILSQFWEKCPKNVRQQVEGTAKLRLQAASDNDIVMTEASGQGKIEKPPDELPNDDNFKAAASRRQSMPILTLTETELDSPHRQSNGVNDQVVLRPSDPDPYMNVGLDNVRLRSRRASVAPLTPEEVSGESQRPSPSQPRRASSSFTLAENPDVFRSQATTPRPCVTENHCILPDNVLVGIFQYLELHHLFRFRAVSLHWSELLSKSPDLFHHVSLSLYNRTITDDVLVRTICPFIGERARYIDISNCFHITDEGFSRLVNMCGANVVSWKMKSVWDVNAPCILDMAGKASDLEEVDMSNCRKVGDTLLARILGWVVPGPYRPIEEPSKPGKTPALKPTMVTDAGTIYGCPKLKRLTLQYCKHVTDRSMHHIAAHAAPRIEEMDLTRCTTITDNGFHFWGRAQFSRLRKLCLADCTYLTDQAIVYLTSAAKQLQELDLSFCCALSDTSTEVIALQCSQLTYLNMSFCGSAISDPSLRCIGLHLLHLKRLSVRGCVRVTRTGVEAVADGCHELNSIDVSQCKNLIPWLEKGGPLKYKGRICFDTVLQTAKFR